MRDVEVCGFESANGEDLEGQTKRDEYYCGFLVLCAAEEDDEERCAGERDAGEELADGREGESCLAADAFREPSGDVCEQGHDEVREECDAEVLDGLSDFGLEECGEPVHDAEGPKAVAELAQHGRPARARRDDFLVQPNIERKRSGRGASPRAALAVPRQPHPDASPQEPRGAKRIEHDAPARPRHDGGTHQQGKRRAKIRARSDAGHGERAVLRGDPRGEEVYDGGEREALAEAHEEACEEECGEAEVCGEGCDEGEEGPPQGGGAEDDFSAVAF
mmetsp:Transcript_10695/g.28105  ORF Transcript_10695/g.28105 Transcript_10695/m.28105 type:complete len:277 (-) Transcript_10695:354-1184(-)